MVNSPYSLSADDVRVFTEEDWRGMHLNAFRGDRLPISQSGTVTGTVISSNMYQDQTSQARTAPFYSNFTSPVAPRHFDWGPILRNEMPGASLDRHCTTESPGMASLEVQSAPDTTSPLTFNVWGQESHSFIDSNNGFSQEPSPQADFRSASTSRYVCNDLSNVIYADIPDYNPGTLAVICNVSGGDAIIPAYSLAKEC